ncbi:MAG: homocysteine S-methyltransferase family protein [Candidatus Nanopelagicales bacterium]
MSALLDAIRVGDVRVGDGAMGTMLQNAGLDDGGAPELWNVEKADVIERILTEYADAGAQLLTTNTFGGSRPRLQMHGLEDRVIELNRAAAQIARGVADAHEGVFVLGDIGPSGELLEPMGTLTPESAQELFAEQMRGLVEGGVDGFLIETMSDLAEVRAAIAAARDVAPDLPVVATLSFDTNLHTMMGVSPAQAVVELSAMGADMVGANCGRGFEEMHTIVEQMVPARPEGVLLMMQSNAGLPELVGADFVYNGTPEGMAELASDLKAMGVNVVGSCCGSTPEHTAAIRAVMFA